MPSRVAVAIVVVLFAGTAFARQAAQNSAPLAPPEVSASPEGLYRSLTALRVNPQAIYHVHNLTLRRDGIAFTFTEGEIGLFEPLDGRVTGAVFLGRGRIFALPPDAAERSSLVRFIKVPFLDLEFWQAYLRFDRAAADEIRAGLGARSTVAANNINFAQNWAPVLASLNPASSLRLMENWLSPDPRPYFFAGLNSPGVGSFDVMLDASRPETIMIGQPKTANGARYFNVWTSYAASAAPPPRPEFVPLRYAIDITIASDLSLTGETTLYMKAMRGGSRMLELELSRFLRVQSVEDAAGEKLVFFQNQDLRRQAVARRGNNLLFVALPAPPVPGSAYTLRIVYHGTVIEDAGNGVYFVGARGSWYPHPTGPDYFTPFDLTFHWPKPLTLVATGQQVASQVSGSERSGRWRTTEPIALAGFNLGDYSTETIHGAPLIRLFANQQLEDAIVARLKANALTPPGSLVPELPPRQIPGLSAAPDFPLPNPAAVLKTLGGKLLTSVHYLEKLNGPFPFPELDVSQIPGTFGEGWPGLLYLSTYVFLPPEAQVQAGLEAQAQQQVEEIVPYHEAVHQWWGNVVVPASYRDVWIEEAMANYEALMYDASRHPGKHHLQIWLGRFRSDLLAKPPGKGAPVDQAGPLDFGYRLDTSRTPDAYNTIIYEKGAWVIHMLRMMLRERGAKNPDARFERLLHNILETYRFHTLSTGQFEQAVTQVMTPSMDLEGSRSMDWFFDEWVRSTGIPQYRVTFHSRFRGRRFEVEGTLGQSGVSDLFTEAVPIYAARPPGKAVFLGRVVTTGPETHFRFFSSRRPSKLLIDPEHTLLCTTP